MTHCEKQLLWLGNSFKCIVQILSRFNKAVRCALIELNLSFQVHSGRLKAEGTLWRIRKCSSRAVHSRRGM